MNSVQNIKFFTYSIKVVFIKQLDNGFTDLSLGTYAEMVKTKREIKCHISVTLIKPRFNFLLQLMLLVHGDKTDLNASFRYFNEAYCNFFV